MDEGLSVFIRRIALAIGGDKLESTSSEKLLGLYLNSDFDWSTHVEKISTELKKTIGLLRRIRYRIPNEKLVMIAEAIFNSKIRYSIAVYLSPVFDEEDLKTKKLPRNTYILQTLQNKMIRVIFGFKEHNHINMKKIREKFRIMSVNQISIYHTLLETYNIIKNSSSTQIQTKWTNRKENKYSLRSVTNHDLKVPEKPNAKCLGFSYFGAKIFNKLPITIRENESSSSFKSMTKEWIWKNIPSF